MENLEHKKRELLKDFIDSCEWIWSKSMPLIPHEYIVIDKSLNRFDFVLFVTAIRKYGVVEPWRKYNHTYLYLDGYKYWTMGAPISETTIINRQKLFSEYDAIADVYDSFFENNGYSAEDAEVVRLIGYKGEHLTDIGCGTGLFIGLLHVHQSKYTGVDPSKKMVAKLEAKYPLHRVMKKPYEEVFDDLKYDAYAISTYGSASYIMAPYLISLRGFKRLFLMFYKPDYIPVTYIKAKVELTHFIYTKEFLAEKFIGCKIYEFHNYIIVQK